MCCVEWCQMREKVRPAGGSCCRSERKFALLVQNGQILPILCLPGEFCTGWGAGGVLLGEFCTGWGAGGVLPGEFCTGWGAGGVLLGEFCTGRGWKVLCRASFVPVGARKGPCWAMLAAIPRPTLRCTCPLQRHGATTATTPCHAASRRNRVTASPGRNIAPLPDPATVTPAKARQARHNKARSRDGSADDGLFFGHADDAGALAQG